MAVYLVHSQSGGASLVRAKNGHRAIEIIDDPRSMRVGLVAPVVDSGVMVVRVQEDGSEGVIWSAAPVDAAIEDNGREVDVTNFDDLDNRKFMNLKTGKVRAEPIAKKIID